MTQRRVIPPFFSFMVKFRGILFSNDLLYVLKMWNKRIVFIAREENKEILRAIVLQLDMSFLI